MGGAVVEIGGVGMNQGLYIYTNFLIAPDRGIGPHQSLPVGRRQQKHGILTIHGEGLRTGFEQHGQGELVKG